MLEKLAGVLSQRGYLSGIIIDEVENLPSSSSYASRFGSLLRAYALVGFVPDHDYRYLEINRSLRRLYPKVLADAILGVEMAGGSAVQDPGTDLITRSWTRSGMIPSSSSGSIKRWELTLMRRNIFKTCAAPSPGRCKCGGRPSQPTGHLKIHTLLGDFAGLRLMIKLSIVHLVTRFRSMLAGATAIL